MCEACEATIEATARALVEDAAIVEDGCVVTKAAKVFYCV